MLREFYQSTVPLPLRRLRWLLKNDFKYIFGDRQAARVSLDYENYWERKVAEGQLWLSYREIVDICMG